MAAQQKKIHALKRGSERRKNLYHRMQEELLGISCIAPVQPSSPCPTTSTPTTSTPLREISNVPSGQEPYCLPEQNVATDDHDYGSFREWLKKPSYLSYPWEEIPEMPFQKVRLSNPLSRDANWKVGRELLSIFSSVEGFYRYVN